MYILVKAEQFTIQTLISLHPKEDTPSLTQDQIQAFIKRKKKITDFYFPREHHLQHAQE